MAFPSPGHLPDPGIKPGSPALQEDSLPTESPAKPSFDDEYYYILKKDIFSPYLDLIFSLYIFILFIDLLAIWLNPPSGCLVVVQSLSRV